MKIITVKDYDEMSQVAADMVQAVLASKPSSVLGLATGSTPEGMYAELRRRFTVGEVDFSEATTFNLDEYVGIDHEHPNSYHAYMNQQLFNEVNLAPGAKNLPSGESDNPDQAARDYEATIAAVGGIDMQVLGLGLNGHIGFNEPGSAFDSQTRVVELTPSTISANARFFDSENQVPTQAVTMGIGTIMKAKKILLLVSGEAKTDILRQALQGEVTEAVPASVLQRHSDVTVVTDSILE